MCQLFWLESCGVLGIDANNCVYNGGKLNPRSLLYRMVYGRAGFYLPSYFPVYMDDLSNMLIRSGVGCYVISVNSFIANVYCLPVYPDF